jgi:hypothetical protein
MSSQAQTASRLLAKYGEAVSIIFPVYGATDPITGAVIGTDTSTTINGKGYPAAYHKNDIDGTVIQAGDIRLILELIATRPDVGCLSTIDGTTYRIMDVQPIRLTGEDVIYICQLRSN